MTAVAQSPLSMLVQKALDALGVGGGSSAFDPVPLAPTERMEEMAAGLLASMGFGEVADDLDLRATALLGAASVVGLKVIQAVEPGIYRLESAVYALEDLLRRTADGAR